MLAVADGGDAAAPPGGQTVLYKHQHWFCWFEGVSGCKRSINEPSVSFLLYPQLACGQHEAEVRHHYTSPTAFNRPV